MRRNMLKKCRLVNMKFFMISLALFSMYLTLSYTFLQMLTKKINKIGMIDSVLKLPNVVFHLDLKGAPPKLGYLKSLLPELQEMGVTSLLIEYEDMFPYEDKLKNLSARNFYEKSQLQDFLTLAVHIGFDIIPLIQTFGHMEHVLKLEEFQELREAPLYPDSICPSKPESRLLIKNMLEQVIKFHEDIIPLKYFHIGGDEVYHINKCQQCLRRHLPKIKVYTNHMKAIVNMVKELSPSATVLIWDDMLRNVPMKHWKSVEKLEVEPVYWDYKPYLMVSHINMVKYHRRFSNIWIASAFKGADGRTATLPNMKDRFLNHLNWMELIHDYKFGGETEVYNFKGIILTGWSRYSHMDPPCELLPVSIPSLFLNLLLIKKLKNGDNWIESDGVTDFFRKNLKEEFSKHLHCNDLVNIEHFASNQCRFDGTNLYQHLENCDKFNINVRTRFNTFLNHDFYTKINNINMNIVQQDIKWCNKTINDLLSLKGRMVDQLKVYYDEDVVEEFVNYKLNNSKTLLDKLYKNLNNVFQVRFWKNRYN